MADIAVETDRLILREWVPGDLDALHAICSDSDVMATIGPLLSREQASAMIVDLTARSIADGHTFWALDRKADRRMIGFTGLKRADIDPIKDRLEIGWRLAHDCWGRGYATEAAAAALGWAREHRPGEDIYAITAEINDRSRAVMRRLGMMHRPEADFDHPKVPEDSALRPHVTYFKQMDTHG